MAHDEPTTVRKIVEEFLTGRQLPGDVEVLIQFLNAHVAARAVVEYYVSPTGHCFACDGAEHKHWERCRIGKLATAVQAIEEGRDDLRGIVEAWCMRQYKALLPGDALRDLITALEAHVAARLLNERLLMLETSDKLATVTEERDRHYETIESYRLMVTDLEAERDQARADLAAAHRGMRDMEVSSAERIAIAVAAEREACLDIVRTWEMQGTGEHFNDLSSYEREKIHRTNTVAREISAAIRRRGEPRG